MVRPEKVEAVEALRARLARARGVILTDYRGLTVPEMNQLRTRLREARVEYRVVKNRLLLRAARAAGIEGLESYLEGPTAAAFGYDDPVVAARVIQEFIRQMRKLETKGGIVEGRAVTPEQVRALADLPPRPVLLAQVVGGLQAPLGRLVGVLTGLQRNLVWVLAQVQARRAGTAGEGAAAAGAGATVE
jgi:large subunit ribosomal protein L10